MGSEEDALLSSEEEKNMALVRRFLEAQANADLDTIEELLAPDFVDRSLLPGQEPTREGYKQQLAEQHAALSDVRCIIEDQLAQGEKVVTRVTWRSVHDRGEYFGLMPRDKMVEVTAMAMHRIEGGKIAEEWGEGSGGALEVAEARLEQEVLKRERVEEELMVARRIQQASLPKEVPELEGWQIAPYFPQNRAGLRSLQRWAKRFPERHWAVENAGVTKRSRELRYGEVHASGKVCTATPR